VAKVNPTIALVLSLLALVLSLLALLVSLRRKAAETKPLDPILLEEVRGAQEGLERDFKAFQGEVRSWMREWPLVYSRAYSMTSGSDPDSSVTVFLRPDQSGVLLSVLGKGQVVQVKEVQAGQVSRPSDWEMRILTEALAALART
jgi:hypothetical protein